MCPTCIAWTGKRLNQKTKKQTLRKKCSRGTITQGKRYVIAHWNTYTSICFLITALILARVIQESVALILYLVLQETRVLHDTIGFCPHQTLTATVFLDFVQVKRVSLVERRGVVSLSLASTRSDNSEKFTGPLPRVLKFLLLSCSFHKSRIMPASFDNGPVHLDCYSPGPCILFPFTSSFIRHSPPSMLLQEKELD